MPVKVLFVCMGNICRSPTAEAVFAHLLKQAQLEDKIQIDSAGTHGYHIGESPDVRSIAAGQKRGYQLAHLRARQVTLQDFEKFDHIVAMDSYNHKLLLSRSPAQHHPKISLFLEHVVESMDKDVPDPYYGGVAGFDRVIDLIEAASSALLNKIKAEQGWL